ncbi:MAG: hypothetical protein QOF06_1156 [Solirubrobacterales bacterium]|jgi:hypothetical protein|nr:hypothetical protein [Solirubrobacterales bacterium]
MSWERTTAGSARHGRAFALVLLLGLVLPLIWAAPAARAAFGLKSLSSVFIAQDGDLGAQPAGSHPEAWRTEIAFNTTGHPGEEFPDGALKDLRISLPPGLVGAPALLSECAHSDYLAEACSASTEVGRLSFNTGQPLPDSTLYLLEPPAGTAAQLGFHVQGVPVTIDLSISRPPPHNLIASITNASQAVEIFGATLTLDGTPNGKAFLTMPRSCTNPLQTTLSVSSWQAPGIAVLASAPEPQPMNACGALSYSPSLEVRPTTGQPTAPSGLDLTLSAPDQGIASPSGRAQADTERAVLRLPADMTVNPPVAAGLAACDPVQLAAETPGGAPGDGCPQSSKLGTAEVQTPLFAKPLAGTIFLATPDDPTTDAPGAENPFDSLLALHLVIADAERGVLLTLPIEIAADPDSGRLTATLDQIPQLPLSRLELHFNSGPHAPLTTPGGCGTQAIAYTLTPSSGNAPLQGADPFAIGGDCARPFAPTLAAGTANPAAGRSSPFVLDLIQASGEEKLSRFSLTLPPGLSADFAAVPFCPEALAAAGRCPADSSIGFARIAAGSGPAPLWVPDADSPPGRVYLAGPYAGAPFSLVVVVRAHAGPFDLGAVVTRAAIAIDPETARATVRLDPLPRILAGVPIEYRVLRLVLDRPGFIRNPTSCATTAVHARLTSAKGTVAPASDRFQVGDCAQLAFKPKLSMRLLGSTRRGAHPRLRIVLQSRPGDANLKRVSGALPSAELLDTRRIRDVCSRADFAASNCPPGSAYGHAKAWTPLLDRPLEGPVYLRESKSRLPDLAVALGGQIDLALTAHLDATRGRLRNTFEALPDTPLRKVVLTMAGGKKGLLVNSGGLCSRPQRVQAGFLAHSGRHRRTNPVVATDCKF